MEENRRGRLNRGRRGGDTRDVRNVTGEDMPAESSASSDDFYVFSTGNSDDQNTLKLEIEDKPINVIVDSGASCNLMSQEVFDHVTGGNVKLLECNKRVFAYAYASVESLPLKGKCKLKVCVPQTQLTLGVDFYVTHGKAATLLDRNTSELLGVLRVCVSVNNYNVNDPSNNARQGDRKASLKAKFPKVVQGLGKLRG